MALWTNCHAESGIQHLKMIWTLPAEPPLQVTYMVEPQDAWVLWNSLRNSQKHPENTGDDPEDNIDIGEVKRFVQALKSHFYRHFRLDLSAGRLSQVSTALGSAKCNGRIKVPSQTHRKMLFICCRYFNSGSKFHRERFLHFKKCNWKSLLHFPVSLFFPFSADFQQQIHDHHLDATDRVCSPQNAHLRATSWTFFFYAKNIFFPLTARIF